MFLKAHLDADRLNHFFQTGRDDIRLVLDMVRKRVAPDFSPATALDFGSGVGRLVFAMAEHVQRVIGVDISPAMLAEARRKQPERSPYQNVSFLDHIPDGQVDWISSLLILQHIPPARGIAFLRTLLGRLALGGVVSLQFTAYREPGHLAGAFDETRYLRFDGDDLKVLEQAIGQDVRMAMYDHHMTQVPAVYASAGIPPDVGGACEPRRTSRLLGRRTKDRGLKVVRTARRQEGWQRYRSEPRGRC